MTEHEEPASGQQAWRAFWQVSERYRVDLVGLDRTIVGEGQPTVYNPFKRSTLPEELAKVGDEETALGFVRRNGVLAYYFHKEPLAFIYHEARKTRLAFALLKALQDAEEDDDHPLLKAALRDLIGTESLEQFFSDVQFIRPTWREYPSRPRPTPFPRLNVRATETGIEATGVDEAMIRRMGERALEAARDEEFFGFELRPGGGRPPMPERLLFGTSGGIARYIVSDLLDAPVETPPEVAPPFPDFTQQILPGVPVNRRLEVSEGRLVVTQSVLVLIHAIRWWIQEEVQAERPIRLCPWCHNFFFAYDGRQRYCRRPSGDPDPAGDSLCATAARGKRFRGRRGATPDDGTSSDIG